MSNITKIQKESHLRECAFPYCTNKFSGPPQQKYCSDPRCQTARAAVAKKNRKPKIDPDVDNLKLVKGKFPRGTMLRIQCAACGPSGRCSNKVVITYDPKREIYPKYCEQHRNAYKRARFEGRI